MTSYEDYLATVRAQRDRDRDRFTGVDAHEGEPMYDASTGAPVWPEFEAALQQYSQHVTEWANQLYAALEPFLQQMSALLREKEAAEKAQLRHTYPRQRREWWNR